MPVLTKLRKIRKRNCPTIPLGGRGKQTLGLDYRLAHEVSQICSLEEAGRRRGLTEPQVCVTAVPPHSIQHSGFNFPACSPCAALRQKWQMCIKNVHFHTQNCGNFISLWYNAVKTPVTSHWKWQHPEDRDFCLKSILFSCHKSMSTEKLPHNWETSSMSAAGTKSHRGKERWQELCSTFLHCKTWVRGGSV